MCKGFIQFLAEERLNKKLLLFSPNVRVQRGHAELTLETRKHLTLLRDCEPSHRGHSLFPLGF